MPSLHTALPCAVAIVLWGVRQRLGLAAAAYTALMAISLVYLGEHYVSDTLVAVVSAFAAHGALSWAASRSTAFALRWRLTEWSAKR